MLFIYSTMLFTPPEHHCADFFKKKQHCAAVNRIKCNDLACYVNNAMLRTSGPHCAMYKQQVTLITYQLDSSGLKCALSAQQSSL
jgi:hypothetical protein